MEKGKRRFGGDLEERDAVNEGVELVGVREGGVRWGQMIGRQHHSRKQPRGE